jgi:hypothetical protein
VLVSHGVTMWVAYDALHSALNAGRGLIPGFGYIIHSGLDQSRSALHLLPVQYAEPSPVQFVTVVRNEIRGGVR